MSRLNFKHYKPRDPDEQIPYDEDGFPLEMEPDDLGDDQDEEQLTEEE